MARKKQSSSGIQWITLLSGIAIGVALTLGARQVLELFMGDLVTNTSESVTYQNPEVQELSFRFFDLLTEGDDIDSSEPPAPTQQPSLASSTGEAPQLESQAQVETAPLQTDTVEPETSPISTVAAAETNEGPNFLLQAGSFRGADAAESRRARILLLGLPASTVRVEVPGGGVWNRVIVGPFDTKQQTQAARDRLRVEMDIDPLAFRRDA